MTFVDRVIVGNVRCNDRFADVGDEYRYVFFEKMVCVKANTQRGVSGDQLKDIRRIATKAGAGKILDRNYGFKFFCVFGKSEKAVLCAIHTQSTCFFSYGLAAGVYDKSFYSYLGRFFYERRTGNGYAAPPWS